MKLKRWVVSTLETSIFLGFVSIAIIPILANFILVNGLYLIITVVLITPAVAILNKYEWSK